MKKRYVNKDFQLKSLRIIDQANEIISEYQEDDLDLTLRQLYYQFVSRDLIANKQSEYSRLGSIINDARLAGLIDWYSIVDRTRNVKSNSHWRDPGEIIRSAAASFMVDHWEGQPYRVECWIEKEALIGVIANVCRDLDVRYFACKGYVSQSELWRGAQRHIKSQRLDGVDVQTIVLHLGDHDPSGMDMTRDNQERLNLFWADSIVKRIALTWEQIEEFNPPPNPAKMSDSRSANYVNEFGYESWELDALEPRVLRDLIRSNVEKYFDEDIYSDVEKKENEYLEILNNVSENWKSL